MDEVTGVLEGAGISSDRLRMPNKPPWDYEDFVADDPTFLERYFEGRRADAPMVRVSVIQNPYLFTVSFRDEEQGLISGLGGVILRSGDGGRTWRYERIDRKQALFSVAASNPRHRGRREGADPRVDRRRQLLGAARAGRLPDRLHLHARPRLRAQRPVGFIVGQQGMVLRSRDSGRSWARVLPPGRRPRGGPDALAPRGSRPRAAEGRREAANEFAGLQAARHLLPDPRRQRFRAPAPGFSSRQIGPPIGDFWRGSRACCRRRRPVPASSSSTTTG